MIAIYYLENPMGERYYGATMNYISRKWSHHIGRHVNGPLLEESYERFGPENHTFFLLKQFTIDEIQTKGQLEKHEKEFIQTFELSGGKTLNLNHSLFNKRAKVRKPVVKRMMVQKGKKHKQIIEKGEKEIIQYSLEGIELNRFPSVLEAALVLEIHKNIIYSCLNGYQRTGKGFLFSYKLKNSIK